MGEFSGGDDGPFGEGASDPGRRRRRRGRRSRGSGPAEPTLERVLLDAARQGRPNKKRRSPEHSGPREGFAHAMKRGDGRGRRVRPAGREMEELPFRRDPADYQRSAENWWADRWLSVLYRFGWKGRLANGRMYADEGRVTQFLVEPGRVRATVQGSRTQAYDVTIQIRPLPDSDWDLIVDILSCQALFTAQLLAGEMPLDIEEVFVAAYAPLFPRTKEDIRAHCTCPDYANPCKHIAATYYVLADNFDKDPFLIFHLRGRSREELIAMLRAARAAEAHAGTMTVETLDAGSLEPFRFWQAGEELASVHVQMMAPPFPGATAKRLGRPPFWRSPADPITRLSEVYEAIAQRAREVAVNEAIIPGQMQRV